MTGSATGAPLRRLVAVMFTDIVGSSSIAQRNEQHAFVLHEEHDRLLKPVFAEFAGVVVKSRGDGFLVTFENTLDAVNCGIAIQTLLFKRNAHCRVDDRIHVRIGVHVCDVVHQDGDVFGDGVNIAARIEPVADADGICISEDVARQVRGKITEPLEKLPPQELRNITLPIAVYRVRLPWTQGRRHRSVLQLVVRTVLAGVVFAAGFTAGYLWKPSRGGMQHGGAIQALATSSQLLASGADDKTIKLWDPNTQKELRTLRDHTRPISSLALTSDGKVLVSASWDRTVHVWDVATGKVKFVLSHPRNVFGTDISPDGRTIASACADEKIRLWNADAGHLVREVTGHEGAVNVVRFSPDGATLASGGDDEKVRLWNATTGAPIRVLTGHSDLVWDLAFSNDGQWLASASYDHTIKIWRVSNGEELETLSGHTDTVTSVCFSNDGRTLVSGAADGTVRAWDVTAGREVHQVKDLGGVNVVACRSDGTVAIGTEDGEILPHRDLLKK